MILPAILLVFATACTPNEIDKEQPESTSCEAGFILDGSVCVPESCRTGTWGNLPVDSDTVYVDMAAEEGGDGTEVAPFDAIQEGIDHAGEMGGGLVAVAAGTYPETLAFTTDHADVHLAGRCREMVILDVSVGDGETYGIGVDAPGAAVELSGVAVVGSDWAGVSVKGKGTVVGLWDVTVKDAREYGYGVQVQGGAILSMDGCLIEANYYFGLIAADSGTQIDLQNTTVKGNHPDANGEYGRGIVVQDGAALSAEGCLVEGNSDSGLLVDGLGTQINLRATTIKDTDGWGIGVQNGAVLSADGCLIEGNRENGVIAFGPGTQVTLNDTIMRDTLPNANGEFGWGIGVQDGATLSVEGCLIDRNSEVGMNASNPGTQVTLLDTTVKDTQPNANGAWGDGIDVDDGASLWADGCLIEGNTFLGILAFDQGTEVVLRNTDVKNTHPDATCEFGRGIEVQGGATLSAEGCLIEGNSDIGLIAIHSGTEVALQDTTVRDTQPNSNGDWGHGIEVSDGAVFSAEGCLIEKNVVVGMFVSNPDTRVTLLDTIIRDTQPDGNGLAGRGVEVNEGASFSATGCLVERSTDTGVFASSPGTEVLLYDTIIRDTIPVEGGGGIGIDAFNGASLSAEGCIVEGMPGLGVVGEDPDTTVVLRDSIIRGIMPTDDGANGFGVLIHEGASLIMEGGSVYENTGSGVIVDGLGSDAVLEDGTIRDTRPYDDGSAGRGIQVTGGAVLTAVGCLIEGNTELGMMVGEPGTLASLFDTTVSNTGSGTSWRSSSASGVTVQDGAHVSASNLVLLSNQGPGIIVNRDGALLECVECFIEDNQFAGAVVLRDGILSISDSVIEGTTPSTNLIGGSGIYTWPWDGDPPSVTITNTLIQDNPIAGVWLIGDGTYVLTGNTIIGGTGEPFGSGSRCGDAILARDGVTAWDGTSGLLLQDNVFQDASGSGIFLDNSSALMSGNGYSDNALDLVVQNQSCAPIPAWYSEAPQRDLCPAFDYPTCYAEFFYAAMPADPVEEGAALRPRLLPMNPVASLARSSRSLKPSARFDHPSNPGLSR